MKAGKTPSEEPAVRDQPKAKSEPPKAVAGTPASQSKPAISIPLIIRRVPTPLPAQPEPSRILPAAPSEPALLEHDIAEDELIHPSVLGKVDYGEALQAILDKAQLSVPPEHRARAESLVVSALKGVRDEGQFIVYATKSATDGGLGWSRAEAGRVAEIIAAYREHDQELPMIAATPQPQLATEPKADPRPSKQPPAIKAPARPALSPLPAILPRQGLNRPLVNDIAPAAQPAENVVMGPVEEIRTFGLADWRRLGATPSAAASAFTAKCLGYKEESLLLYMDVLFAWRHSPLMREYLAVTAEALGSGRSIHDVIASRSVKTELTEADIAAIVEVNRHLTV